ncbi:Clavaminate synthase-like protein [Colletotrichum eremochloae]|nr:Clavaminate synthase-like protein [Colletotrichum eremochloae]
MPGLTHPTTAPLAQLRTIKFSSLLDRDPAELTKLIRACEEVGFFYLDLTSPCDEKMLRNLEDLSALMKGWFMHSLEKKLQTRTASNSHGYKPTGTHAGVGAKRDGWEALKIGRSELMGRWALPSVVEGQFEKFSDFQAECHFVTKVLLGCISTGLDLKGNRSLHQYHRDDTPSKSSLFFLHYPPLDDANAEMGQNMHTDIGSLTLLFALQWGLQVLCPSDIPCPQTGEYFEWRSVEPRPNHAIINVGDTLRFLSGGRLRSALHRALPLEQGDRYSVAYFLRPSDDAEFADSNGTTTSAVEWYLKKNETYERPHQLQDESVLVGGMKQGLKV